MKIPLDLTPDIPLSEQNAPIYLALRVVVLAIFLGFGSFVVWTTVFPDADKYFDFRVYHGAANTIANPRLEDDTPVADGAIPKDAEMIANATASGDFSRIAFSFRGEQEVPSGTVSAVRAYRAFLAPIGMPVTFRDGSLLRDEDEYFIVSQGQLRAFSNERTLRSRGYDPKQFRSVESDMLGNTERGIEIGETELLPNGAVLFDGEQYLQIRDGKRTLFVSDRAYRSRFREEDALSVDAGLLEAFPKSHETIGFLDGTLVSYGEAVYAVEGSLLRPIDAPETFLSKGYDWASVIPITGDEFGIYERGRLYTEQQPHPDGMVFHEASSDTYFLVEGGVRHEIPEAVLPQFDAVTAVSAGLVPIGECTLRNEGRQATCELSWEPEETETGAEYQFTYHPNKDVALRDMHARFVREPNRRNFDRFIAETIQKIRIRSPFSR
jgi:hypothetical protein